MAHLELILVRHAKSSWKDASLRDEERPLNKRGRRDGSEMGRRLAAAGQHPERIVTSTAVRAKTTAWALGHELGIPESAIELDERLYLASVPRWLEVMKGWSDQQHKQLACGHNPGITDLVLALSGTDLVNLPTAAVVILDIPVSSWTDVEPGLAHLRCYDFPKNEDADALIT